MQRVAATAKCFTLMTHRLLLRIFVAQLCCGTYVARLSWAVAELRNKLLNPNLNSNLL